VLGFPCNQFGGQEPGEAADIKGFCDRDYGVTFPLFAKIEVNGRGEHPLYRLLKRARPGALGTSRSSGTLPNFSSARTALWWSALRRPSSRNSSSR
jgi:glutathione peroxidase